MPLFYSVIARGSTVLARYAMCKGNFSEVTDQILSRIPPEDGKLTYSHVNYLFHYISEDHIIYLCITDDVFERAKAFMFLNEIKKKFQVQYGQRARTALPYAMNSEFSRELSLQMRYFSDVKNTDKLEKVKNQVDELKEIIVRDIDQITDRNERLELLVDKANDLNVNSVSFKKSSVNLARSLWRKNVKICVLIFFVVVIILYVIVSITCGGLDWPCTRS
ncbi:vesicle-associated membrane protein 7-like [Argonauta hians]